MKLASFALASVAVIACGKQDKTEDKAKPEAKPTATAAGDLNVDVCSFVTKDAIEGVIGKLSAEPKSVVPKDALRGGCEWAADGSTTALAHARPAKDWYVPGQPTEVAGLGEQALWSSQAGLFVKLAGKPYFLQFLVTTPQGFDQARATALANVVVPAAK